MKTISIILIVFSLTLHVFGQKKINTKCRIWQTSDFCNFPDSLNVPKNWAAEDCTWDFKSCESYTPLGQTAIWLTFTSDIDSVFFLKSKYENISIVHKSDSKATHPMALLWYKNYYSEKNCIREYMPSTFKAKKCMVNFKPKERTDLILIFSKAEIGDKLIIDNFIETEVQK